ncbi:hypothetical protein [Rhodoplanes roseus]|uniref:Uncharacterized protein n=1 Tax=Rhodoplanes roseus TaxID=29409 RepID=A0A327KM99_9BRAD|nr:hypothetical protein [Rhodoplanes roseus]RAI39431.1 hypothetical protein CH341_25885 [Rhodoplanes roseus]
MRILVVVAHYFRPQEGADLVGGLGSGRAPFAKIAALNAQLVALHRHFGPRRASLDPDDPQGKGRPADTLDIVVLTQPGANLLDYVGLAPPAFSVEHADVAPMMLAFEAQRIMRERAGAYDLYAYMEDDLIVHDPAFFAKIAWFAETFGPRAVLLPVRCEMGWTGTPAKVAIDGRLSRDALAPFRRDVAPVLTGSWNGRSQSFRLPGNPHAGCFVVTAAQLAHWMAQPSFYDRDASWGDPLISAATLAPGKVFGLYKPAEPDPWFLEIEHFGTRYAAIVAPEGERYGEPPLLALVEAASRDGAGALAEIAQKTGLRGDTINALIAEAGELRWRLERLERSRSALFKALLRATFRRRKPSR